MSLTEEEKKEVPSARKVARADGQKRYLGGPCKYSHSGWRLVSNSGCVECIAVRKAKKVSSSESKTYDPGFPCKRGHNSLRWVSNGSCVECTKISMSEFYRRNPGKNSSKTRHFYNLRPEYYREAKRQYKKEHQAETIAAVKARELLKTKRMPTWLTDEHKAQIKGFYKLARQQSKETGIKMHVDHKVPLQGRTVSGLHVPWNLQILPEKENLSKSNKHYGQPDGYANEEHLLPIVVAQRRKIVDLDDGTIYVSLTSAANTLGCSISAVSLSIKRGGKCKGRRFAYADTIEGQTYGLKEAA